MIFVADIILWRLIFDPVKSANLNAKERGLPFDLCRPELEWRKAIVPSTLDDPVHVYGEERRIAFAPMLRADFTRSCPLRGARAGPPDRQVFRKAYKREERLLCQSDH